MGERIHLALGLLLFSACTDHTNHNSPSSPVVDSRSDKLSFWDRQRRGANSQNRSVGPSYWHAAAKAGIEFIRLVPDGWEATSRDFLIGDADAFHEVEPRDLTTLERALDQAHDNGVRVVVCMFSLPGARWKQLNDDVDDQRLWRDRAFHQQAFAFWRRLAAALRDHPAVVAYNPLNEPHPERAFGIHDGQMPEFDAWYARSRGTAADLNAFNRGLVAAIRQVDRTTPIILDGWMYASAEGLTRLEPLADRAVLYAFHSYEPWDYTTYRVNKGRFAFPERMPPGWSGESRARELDAVARWASENGVPVSRIIAAEFGVDRRVDGAREYLRDTIRHLDTRAWHWAFYAFRGDGAWGGLDYELGTGPLGGHYWVEVERGTDPEALKHRGPNPLWRVITDALQRAE